MSCRKTIIGITLGDINGVGPEIALAATSRVWLPHVRLVLIGSRELVAEECKRTHLPVPPEWTPSKTSRLLPPVSLWDPPTPSTRHPATLKREPGRCTAAAARAAHHWICCAVDAAKHRTLHAIVTAPIQKEGFMKAGIDVPGHTELLARELQVKRVEMMLLAGSFRVVLATRHIPIRRVADTLTRASVRDTIEMTADAIRWLGARRQRIAVCGLNPHAGDGGAIGDEDRRIIQPAIRSVRRTGVTLTGPVPADTVFYQVQQGAYDAVVAMYHDQGLAPFKMVAFEKGVNLTLGLPIVRTSPDHGTAYDIAGRGAANPSSMIEAIKLAAKLAHRPQPWRAS